MSAHVETERVDCSVCGSTRHRELARTRDFEYATCENTFVYVRCADCRHVYLQNRPVPSALGTIYPPRYGNWHPARTEALTFRVKNWLDARNVKRLAKFADHPTRILDVGCADGRLLDVCRRALPSAVHLHGVEISDTAAAAAQAKGYPIFVGSIDDALSHEAIPYDLIFMQQVIEHVHQPQRVLERLRDALAPRGALVVETPTHESLDARVFADRYWGGYHVPRHFNIFSESSLVRLAERVDLRCALIEYSPQPIHWVWSLHHVLQDRGWPPWTFRHLNLQNAPAIAFGTALELGAQLLTRKMSNLRVVLRRASPALEESPPAQRL